MALGSRFSERMRRDWEINRAIPCIPTRGGIDGIGKGSELKVVQNWWGRGISGFVTRRKGGQPRGIGNTVPKV
jgi:hypothetical protein